MSIHPINENIFKYKYLGMDTESLRKSMANRLEYTVGKDIVTATTRDWFNVVAYTIRDRMMERWMETMRTYYREDSKRVYYLSLEFLIGRTLMNSLMNLGIYDEVKQALEEIGLDLDEICEAEPDAALGNGGLGRLAACFLDSLATLGLPGVGYGIRYEYGMFKQEFENGHQVEHPDNWLRYTNPWEFPRSEVLYPIKFNGRVIQYPDENGQIRFQWSDADEVMAMAYDTPIPGYNTNTVNNLRLWSAKSSRDFDLGYFNKGNYIVAVANENESEYISKVLYPDDTTYMGRELRLKQQYFFVCASLQDIINRFLKHHTDWNEFPDKVAIQLNDTHPAVAIPELMRILMDKYRLEWHQAWDITTKTFAYTNHTLLPEALEKWPVSLFGKLLPRHLQIIYEINHRFLRDVMHYYPGNCDLLRDMSIIEEGGEQHIRMAHLAIVGSHTVNGVAALHTQLMKDTIFSNFNRFYPNKIINKTNGVTPRRWLHHANPKLSALIDNHIGEQWTSQLDDLEKLSAFAENPDFLHAFTIIKNDNKQHLASLIKKNMGVDVNCDSIFDVHIKRIHEYKRQLLNVLHVITLYNEIRHGNQDITPRTVMFAGKAAPGYVMAKLIIKLVNDVADIINNDPLVGNKLKVLFIPNYDVSTASDIIPAADLSEQISTAGLEASGTGNMKLALNGALTIGTLDGANIEIKEEVGDENIFIFGHTAEEVQSIQNNGYYPREIYYADNALKEVIDMIGSGFFSPEEPDRYKSIYNMLLDGGDRYMVLADYADYIRCQKQVANDFQDQEKWMRRAILNVARMGKFSSDRTIREYAEEIWDIEPVNIVMPEND